MTTVVRIFGSTVVLDVGSKTEFNLIMAIEKEAQMGEKLKPCPFCGESKWIRVYHVFKDSYFVTCSCCGCDGPKETTAERATQEWNTRKEDR
jgi:Lar family restriction alleviation protein